MDNPTGLGRGWLLRAAGTGGRAGRRYASGGSAGSSVSSASATMARERYDLPVDTYAREAAEALAELADDEAEAPEA